MIEDCRDDFRVIGSEVENREDLQSFARTHFLLQRLKESQNRHHQGDSQS